MEIVYQRPVHPAPTNPWHALGSPFMIVARASLTALSLTNAAGLPATARARHSRHQEHATLTSYPPAATDHT